MLLDIVFLYFEILKCCRVVVELIVLGNFNLNMNINDLICVLFIIVMFNYF